MNGDQIRPLNDRILVRRIGPAPTKSSIVAPDIAKERSLRGWVVAVGPGKRGKHGKRIPCDVQPGEIVQFGTFTDFDQNDLVMIQEQDVRYVEQP